MTYVSDLFSQVPIPQLVPYADSPRQLSTFQNSCVIVPRPQESEAQQLMADFERAWPEREPVGVADASGRTQTVVYD